MYYLITKWFGVFLFYKKEIIKKKLFKKNSDVIAEILLKIKKNQILQEEKEISKRYDLIVNERRLSRIGIYNPKDNFFKKIVINPEDYKFDVSLLHDASLKIVNINTLEYLSNEDLQIIQMINAFDDLIHISNLLSERLNSWSILPFKEEKINLLKNVYIEVKKQLSNLEEQISKYTEKIAPNTSDLVGPIICARLISKSGGMQRFARFPASTIQILGAEKALFRYKKEGGNPPKHGIIYQHPIINKAEKEKKGKISRLIAGKIAIAAKADFYTKSMISDKLNQEIKLKLKKIRNS
jgi:nucleolar protein 56